MCNGSRRLRRPAGSDDGLFKSNMVLLILLAVCCNGIALILGLIGIFTARDPQAKSNATIVTIIAGIITALGVLAQVAGFGAAVVQP